MIDECVEVSKQRGESPEQFDAKFTELVETAFHERNKNLFDHPEGAVVFAAKNSWRLPSPGVVPVDKIVSNDHANRIDKECKEIRVFLRAAKKNGVKRQDWDAALAKEGFSEEAMAAEGFNFRAQQLPDVCRAIVEAESHDKVVVK